MKKLYILPVISLVIVALLITRGVIIRSNYAMFEGLSIYSSAVNTNNKPSNILLSRKSVETNTNQCLVVYSNKVYLIPSQFIDIHPSKESIKEYCNKDITYYFNTAMHSIVAKIVLDSFYYAELTL